MIEKASPPICMWSGPRNLSTAMMRSFGARADCHVLDEPFFAPFLKVSGKDHPGRAETLAAHETDPHKVAIACATSTSDGSLYHFQKHMPHHMLPNFPIEWARGGSHFFLIRHPARVICSYVKGREVFDIEDLGFAPQRRLFDTLSEITGKVPPIVDCDDILRAPDIMLPRLCGALGLPWDNAMLSWKAGPRETDGAWAPYWYGSVELSVGFSAPPKQLPEVPLQYREDYDACMADYTALAAGRLTF